jgi:hypothetical protein
VSMPGYSSLDAFPQPNLIFDQQHAPAICLYPVHPLPPAIVLGSAARTAVRPQ